MSGLREYLSRPDAIATRYEHDEAAASSNFLAMIDVERTLQPFKSLKLPTWAYTGHNTAKGRARRS